MDQRNSSGEPPGTEADAQDGATASVPNLDALSDEVARLSQATRGFVEEYPLLSFGAVVLAGYVVGRMLRR